MNLKRKGKIVMNGLTLTACFKGIYTRNSETVEEVKYLILINTVDRKGLDSSWKISAKKFLLGKVCV